MGKIEDCFGSKELGQEYAMMAYGQPLYRLVVEEAEERDKLANTMHIQASAGIVSAPGIHEPENERIQQPALQVHKVFHAESLVNRFVSRKNRPSEENRVVKNWDYPQSLLLKNPLSEEKDIDEQIRLLSQGKPGEITVARAMPIFSLMKVLGTEARKHTYAEHVHALSKVALANIW
ncbi:MAG: hypothetical protein U5L95_03830 [Candidatus Saccharibacteria bacterium]|nr:hypothetical protein [Candidatus Saccharibacteria bacterium]